MYDTTPFSFLEKLAASGDADAQFALSKRYAIGDGVRANPKKSAKWANLAAKQGNQEAQRYMGLAYMMGMGVDRNGALALKWLLPSAEAGDIHSCALIGNLYLRENERYATVDYDPIRGIEFVRKAAEGGFFQAQEQLAIFYAMGSHGLEKNPTLAFEWYTKAAESGDIHARYAMVMSYLKGEGVEQSIDKAKEIIATYEAEWDGSLCAEIGKLYSIGTFGENRLQEAFLWWQKGTEREGDTSDCEFGLAMAYKMGIGTEPSLELAKKWLKKACDHGNPDAIKYVQDALSDDFSSSK